MKKDKTIPEAISDAYAIRKPLEEEEKAAVNLVEGLFAREPYVGACGETPLHCLDCGYNDDCDVFSGQPRGDCPRRKYVQFLMRNKPKRIRLFEWCMECSARFAIEPHYGMDGLNASWCWLHACGRVVDLRDDTPASKEILRHGIEAYMQRNDIKSMKESTDLADARPYGIVFPGFTIKSKSRHHAWFSLAKHLLEMGEKQVAGREA